MVLMSLSGACLSFSDAPLLENAELHLEENERVCLVGRNGAGKSTLLKVLSGEQVLDDGQLRYAPDLVVARLQQDPPRNASGTVFDFVAEGLAEQSDLPREYHTLSAQLANKGDAAQLRRLAELHERVDQQGLWHLEKRINDVLSQLGLQADTSLSALSGGWLRKAALARALVSGPDILLLDEPTNHLDIETITWLEKLLLEFKGTLVFISHDRSFIQAMATRIIDLDRGKLVSWPEDYATYLQGKEEELRIEEQKNALFDKKLAQEEVWIRQGIKARRTRNEGRVRALKALRQERQERREVMGKARMQVEEALRSGKIIFELDNVCYQINGKPLVNNFSARIQRGDKIALVGPNGCGKTTLIKLLLGQITPDSGRVHCGTRLEVAYFDQHRATLDPEKTVMDNLAEGKQEVMVSGRSRHVLGYLQDFLFPPQRAMTPVKALSGGERNRLLLAQLFIRPSNLLILDEPTNDLDIETLELLEELLENYQGTVLLVSHDRQFVDNCVTECWIFSEQGMIQSYPGGYYDAVAQQAAVKPMKPPLQVRENEAAVKAEKMQPGRRNSNKLSYHLVRELQQLPQRIEALEARLSSLQAQANDAQFFEQPHERSSHILSELAAVEAELEQTYTRWEELESQNNE